MRTTKAERKNNAKSFYNTLMNGSQICVIYKERFGDNNGCRFLAVCGTLKGYANVIAEDRVLGVEGCWIEFINSICGNRKQTTIYESGFKEWIKKTLGFEITYDDGMAYILEAK